MNLYLKYSYRVKGSRRSYFFVQNDFIIKVLNQSENKDDKKLLSYIERNEPQEIRDSLQNDYSYRMRYVVLSGSNEVISKYYCPYCDSEFEGSTLIKKDVAWDKGPLWSGRGVEFYCPNEHRVLWVRTFVS